MWTSAVIAFGHFLAFFALTAALVLQLALISENPTPGVARRIRRADRAAGIAAILLLIFGFLRVFYYARGAEYYFNNSFFLIKLALFVIVGVMSVYPTLTYIRWHEDLRQGVAPNLSAHNAAKLRRIIHAELTAIIGIIFCASVMARGLGFDA